MDTNPTELSPPPQPEAIKERVVEELRTVYDPEIPVNLYDLGLIYKIEIDLHNNVSIEMTLTNPNCPVAGSMPKSVGVAVEKIQHLSSIKVGLVQRTILPKFFWPEKNGLSSN